MSPELGVAIMLNNYFHDVATALLLASGVVMWIIVKEYDKGADNDGNDAVRMLAQMALEELGGKG